MSIMQIAMVCLSLTVSPSFGEDSPAVITQAMTKILPRLEHALEDFGPGDLAVFDLDNTVFRETQTLGTDEWYSHMLHRLQQKGMDRMRAADVLEPVNLRIKTQSQMRLLEAGLPAFIKQLQDRGVYVIGLTARHPNLADATIHHLQQLTIHFENSNFPAEALAGHKIAGLPNRFLWQGGVAFTDGSPKGLVLRDLIQKTGIMPQQVFAIDDRIQHVHTMVEALLEMRIAGRVIHYLRVLEELTFNPKIADLQYRAFKRLGRIISDAEAEAHLCESHLQR